MLTSIFLPGLDSGPSDRITLSPNIGNFTRRGLVSTHFILCTYLNVHVLKFTLADLHLTAFGRLGKTELSSNVIKITTESMCKLLDNR
jgi:hypothetical protein